jgi:hypothetical protein
MNKKNFKTDLPGLGKPYDRPIQVTVAWYEIAEAMIYTIAFFLSILLVFALRMLMANGWAMFELMILGAKRMKDTLVNATETESIKTVKDICRSILKTIQWVLETVVAWIKYTISFLGDATEDTTAGKEKRNEEEKQESEKQESENSDKYGEPMKVFSWTRTKTPKVDTVTMFWQQLRRERMIKDQIAYFRLCRKQTRQILEERCNELRLERLKLRRKESRREIYERHMETDKDKLRVMNSRIRARWRAFFPNLTEQEELDKWLKEWRIAETILKKEADFFLRRVEKERLTETYSI